MTAPTAKRGRGRPRLADPATIKVTISLTRSIIDALDDRAEVEGIARATAVRAACAAWAGLENRRKKQIDMGRKKKLAQGE